MQISGDTNNNRLENDTGLDETKNNEVTPKIEYNEKPTNLRAKSRKETTMHFKNM